MYGWYELGAKNFKKHTQSKVTARNCPWSAYLVDNATSVKTGVIIVQVKGCPLLVVVEPTYGTFSPSGRSQAILPSPSLYLSLSRHPRFQIGMIMF
jgi:hypothetical protein